MGGPNKFNSITTVVQIGLTKINHPKIRIVLRKETHREIKVHLVQNQPSQETVLRRH